MSRIVRVTFVVFSIGLLFVLSQLPGFAQTSSSTGAIVGVVRDPNGAVLNNAKVSVSNQALGITRETTSRDDGGFVVPLLPPHAGYSVTVEVPGFESWVSHDCPRPVSWLIGKHSLRMGFEARTQQFNFHSPLSQGGIDFTGGGADTLYGAPEDPSVDTAFRDFLVGAPDSTSVSSGLNHFYYRAHDIGTSSMSIRHLLSALVHED